MPAFNSTDPVFRDLPDVYTSPFPHSFDDPKLRALGANDPAMMAQQGATAWVHATQLALQAKAVFAGDIRSDWMRSLVRPDPDGEGLLGIWAGVDFPDTINVGTLKSKLVASGFELASGLLTATPVFGQCLGAAVAAGKFFAMLGGLFDQNEAKAKLIVPWRAYERDLDEDIVRHVLIRMMKTWDWSGAFWPNLAWDDRGFEMLETDEGDDTYAWGIFDSNGEARQTTSAPGGIGGAGLGFMPGSQTIADVVQMAVGGVYSGATGRIDAITQVGTFLPASAQTCTALWEMVMKAGNPDMYKVRAGEVGDAWRGYFDSMRDSFTGKWNQLWMSGDTFDGPINLGKIVSPYLLGNGNALDLTGYNSMLVWPGIDRKDGRWEGDPGNGQPGCVPEKDRGGGDGWWKDGWLSNIYYQAGSQWPPSRCQSVNVSHKMRTMQWRWMDQAVTSPACDNLKKAQHRALYNTTICAYVRPIALPGLPAYGAFLDTSAPIEPGYQTFGDELVARCLHAREVLLTRDLRFKIRLEDVDLIDGNYALKLRQSGVTETSWKQPLSKMTAGSALGDAEPDPPNDGPQGGAPFSGQRVPTGGGGMGALLAMGVAGVAAALAGKAK